MSELRLLLNAAFYLFLGYLVLIGLVWLVTQGEPDLSGVFDLAIKPILWPLRLVLSPFGFEIKTPAHQRPQHRSMDSEELSMTDSIVSTTGHFHSQKQAKEYLVGRIVAEAEREGAPLTEIERKMLYFSETDWAPPGIIEVNAEFERDYDENAYEERIAGLVSSLASHQTPAQQERWCEAVEKLSEGDHYLLVLLDTAAPSRGAGGLLDKLGSWLPSTNGAAPRPRGDFFRLIIFAILVLLGAMVLVVLRDQVASWLHR